jgi:arylsulfatase A-like enzyme/predicted neuraminidase
MNATVTLRPAVWSALLAASVLGALPSAEARAADTPNKPNVLFLFSDDQRADTIAALGNQHIRTPNLDRLVGQGTVCTRAYCMGAQQGAVCVPSRAMLMSGHTLFRVLADLKGQATWPEMFGKAGYTTFMTGKWHNGPESARRSFQEGKAVFFGGMGDPYKLPVQDFTAGGGLTGQRDSGKHSVELFADCAVDFLKRPKGDQPFLCYVAFNAPHDPRVAPKEYHERYNAARPPLPPNFLPQHPFNNGDLTGRDERLAPWPRTPEVVRQHLADYYAAITFLDAQVGRILDALRASGRYDNTLIIFSSDHGLAIGSHGLFGKQNLYDHSMHSPLIFAGPGVPRGRQADALCYLLDVFPTLGDLAGVPAPEGSEGKSLAAVLAGKQARVRDSIFTAYRTVQRAVRDDRWKLIVYPQVNKVQLFDLRDDPAERQDLAADKAHAADRDRLLGLLKDWQKQVGDTQPLRTDKPAPLEIDFRGVRAAVPGVVRAEFIFEKAPFPQCHASTLVEAEGGLVAAWFGGTRERNPDVGIWVSRHEGGAWTAPVEVADGKQPDGKREPCWNPVLFRPKAGPLLLFYKVGPNPGKWWGMLQTSTDGGKTWSRARRLPDGILGPIKNKPVQLADGAILCPSSTEHAGWRVHFERSPDGGRTWQATPALNDGKAVAAIQPSILTHKGGRLQAVGRTRQGKLFETWSDDGGKTWGQVALAGLPNPNSGIDAVTLADGRHLLVYNHTARGRTPLNVAVSADGKAWRAAAVLESEPGEYSYPAVIQTADGLVHVAYTWKRRRVKHVVLDPTKLVLRDLPDGQWPKE